MSFKISLVPYSHIYDILPKIMLKNLVIPAQKEIQAKNKHLNINLILMYIGKVIALFMSTHSYVSALSCVNLNTSHIFENCANQVFLW